MKKKLCPDCNYQEDIDQYEKGYTKTNREYILTFMSRTYIKVKLETGKYSWKGIGWYCHECGHVEKANIIKELSRFSEVLQDAETHEEKIETLVNFDNFLKDNKEFIKNNCPDKLVSILRSL